MWYSLASRWRSLCPSHPLRAGFSQCLSEQFYTAIFIYRGTTLHRKSHSKQLTFFLGEWCNSKKKFYYNHMLLTDTKKKKHNNNNKQVPSYLTVDWHTSVLSSSVSWSIRAGPACSAPVFGPSSSSVCWRDHLVLLQLARFWIIVHNNGPKDCLDQLHSLSCQGLLCLLPFRDSDSPPHRAHMDARPLWDETPPHTTVN